MDGHHVLATTGQPCAKKSTLLPNKYQSFRGVRFFLEKIGFSAPFPLLVKRKKRLFLHNFDWDQFRCQRESFFWFHRPRMETKFGVAPGVLVICPVDEKSLFQNKNLTCLPELFLSPKIIRMFGIKTAKFAPQYTFLGSCLLCPVGWLAVGTPFRDYVICARPLMTILLSPYL